MVAYLLAGAGRASLDAVATLDDIGLEGDGPRAAVQLQEEAAGVAEHRAGLIASPEGRRARGAVLADGLITHQYAIDKNGDKRGAFWRGHGARSTASNTNTTQAGAERAYRRVCRTTGGGGCGGCVGHAVAI